MSDLVRAAGVLVMTLDTPTQFLLMRHADRWDLPKGHCDGDETYEAAARRELMEETGLAIPDDRFDPVFMWDLQYDVRYGRRAKQFGGTPGEIRRKNVRYFLAFIPEITTIEVTEHESSQWFPWSPPHQIQSRSIDPLLAAVAEHFESAPNTIESMRR
ncbi:MAG: NUDIX domain-containing protein [Planctomycetota bacterium]